MIFIDKTTAINFRHSRIDNPGEIKGFTKKMSMATFPLMQSRRTECEILQLVPNDEPLVMGYGESLCHPFDNFNKEIGRKNALERAIRHLDRNMRKQIWTAYLNR
jgi:hypothetical protein